MVLLGFVTSTQPTIFSKQVVNTIWPLPDVRDANFTNATGLTEELKYWLAAYGAIV